MTKHRSAFTSAALGAAGSLLLLAAAPPTSRAVTYTEVGDAGSTLAGAQTVAAGTTSQPLTAIFGTVASGSDADVFRFTITSTSLFSATTNNALTSSTGGIGLDTALFLFNASGQPLLTNDDASGTSVQSTLPAGNSLLANLSPGTYYLALSLSGNEPINSAGQLLFAAGDSTAVRGAAPGLNPPVLSDFDSRTTSPPTGAYEIDLTGAATVAAVPEPSTWALLGAGVALLGVAGVRRQRLA